MVDNVDCAVIGAGAVGLAIARELAQQGREVVILEAAETFGTGVSSRNSEVIHAGIYYPSGSLKAGLCIAGRERLYEFCEKAGVGHRRCGKLIVATSQQQLADLEQIQAAAAGNGVELNWLDRDAVRALEPALSCQAALHSPLTGIIDSHSYMLALLGGAESHGAVLARHSRVSRLWLETSTVLIALNEADGPALRARLVINCASLHATQIAQSIEGFPQSCIPQTWFARGHYFSLAGRAPFRRLVYPIPEAGGLGVHFTLDLAGQARFGPDVEWLDVQSPGAQSPDAQTINALSYDVSLKRAERFYGAIRQFWPQLEDGQLLPAYAGIRPKISGPGEPAADFRIDGAAEHGVAAVINLFGIESPGLTASLAIAGHVAQMAAASR